LSLVIQVTRDTRRNNVQQLELELHKPIYITRLTRDQGCPVPKPGAAPLVRAHHQTQQAYHFFR